MNSEVQKIEKKIRDQLLEGKKIDECNIGDTVLVKIRLKDQTGKIDRVQAYEGVLIAKKNGVMGHNLTVRRTHGGMTTEKKIFPHSPAIESIEVIKKGIVRRAKLYYLRNKQGKAARIKHKYF